jgi:hypothetical protein
MYEVDRRAERLKQWGLVEDHTMRWAKKKKKEELRNDTEQVLDWDIVYEVGALLDGRHCRGGRGRGTGRGEKSGGRTSYTSEEQIFGARFPFMVEQK